MNRFVWSDGFYGQDETLVTQQTAIRIYDGDEKVKYLYIILVLSKKI